MASVQGVNHITFSVRDLARSCAFYVEALGCRAIAKWSRGAYLMAGNTWLALIVADEVTETASSDYSHIAFGCQQDQFERLREAIVEHGGEPWSENRSEGNSFYFLDPDGHQLEIHVGDVASRMAAMKENPWEDIQFFD